FPACLQPKNTDVIRVIRAPSIIAPLTRWRFRSRLIWMISSCVRFFHIGLCGITLPVSGAPLQTQKIEQKRYRRVHCTSRVSPFNFSLGNAMAWDTFGMALGRPMGRSKSSMFLGLGTVVRLIYPPPEERNFQPACAFRFLPFPAAGSRSPLFRRFSVSAFQRFQSRWIPLDIGRYRWIPLE